MGECVSPSPSCVSPSSTDFAESNLEMYGNALYAAKPAIPAYYGGNMNGRNEPPSVVGDFVLRTPDKDMAPAPAPAPVQDINIRLHNNNNIVPPIQNVFAAQTPSGYEQNSDSDDNVVQIQHTSGTIQHP